MEFTTPVPPLGRGGGIKKRHLFKGAAST